MKRCSTVVLGMSLLLVPDHAVPQTITARTFSVMPEDEARTVIKMLMDTRQLPPPVGHAPPLQTSTWKFPPSGLYARGAKVDATNYLVFAAVIPGHIVYFGTPGRELGGPPFVPNGLFFTSVDVEVAGGEPSNVRTKQRIARGGYNWYVSQAGILLRGDYWDAPGKPAPEVFIEFDAPFGKFLIDPPPLDLVEIGTNEGAVVLKIREKSIVLR
jgi:hypothetical protein